MMHQGNIAKAGEPVLSAVLDLVEDTQLHNLHARLGGVTVSSTQSERRGALCLPYKR
jgi:hypothetical protein